MYNYNEYRYNDGWSNYPPAVNQFRNGLEQKGVPPGTELNKLTKIFLEHGEELAQLAAKDILDKQLQDFNCQEI